MIEALVMRLQDFLNPFEVACNSLGVGIRGVLSQEGHPVAYFSDKLNEAKQNALPVIRTFTQLFNL